MAEARSVVSDAAMIALLLSAMLMAASWPSSSLAQPGPAAEGPVRGFGRRGRAGIGAFGAQRFDPASVESSACDFPAPTGEEQVVLFGTHHGSAVATATLVGKDKVTTSARVIVEGSGPRLYVILSSLDSTIWRFEGDVTRIARVVLVGPWRDGVIGVGRERLLDLSDRRADTSDSPTPTGGTQQQVRESPCFAPFDETHSIQGVRARATVERAIKRPVDVFAGAHEVGTLRLPSGAASERQEDGKATLPRGLDRDLYEEYARDHDVVAIDAAAVVSETNAEPYDIMPQELGLVQLLASGAIEKLGGSREFYIAKPFPRFPAQLRPTHFVLGRGVRMPYVSTKPFVTICVVSEETGNVLVGDSPDCP